MENPANKRMEEEATPYLTESLAGRRPLRCNRKADIRRQRSWGIVAATRRAASQLQDTPLSNEVNQPFSIRRPSRHCFIT
jgi:hypothetical protein